MRNLLKLKIIAAVYISLTFTSALLAGSINGRFIGYAIPKDRSIKIPMVADVIYDEHAIPAVHHIFIKTYIGQFGSHEYVTYYFKINSVDLDSSNFQLIGGDESQSQDLVFSNLEYNSVTHKISGKFIAQYATETHGTIELISANDWAIPLEQEKLNKLVSKTLINPLTGSYVGSCYNDANKTDMSYVMQIEALRVTGFMPNREYPLAEFQIQGRKALKQSDNTYAFAHSFEEMYYDHFSGDVRIPLFPKKKCRIEGKTFSCGERCSFIKNDGIDWLAITALTFTDKDLPAKENWCHNTSSIKKPTQNEQVLYGAIKMLDRGDQEHAQLTLVHDIKNNEVTTKATLRIFVGSGQMMLDPIIFRYKSTTWSKENTRLILDNGKESVLWIHHLNACNIKADIFSKSAGRVGSIDLNCEMPSDFQKQGRTIPVGTYTFTPRASASSRFTDMMETSFTKLLSGISLKLEAFKNQDSALAYFPFDFRGGISLTPKSNPFDKLNFNLLSKIYDPFSGTLNIKFSDSFGFYGWYRYGTLSGVITKEDPSSSLEFETRRNILYFNSPRF